MDVKARALLPHEAVAVMHRLVDELSAEAQQLEAKIDKLSGYLDGVLEVLGQQHVAKAAHDLYIASDEDNVAYLNELVERVTA